MRTGARRRAREVPPPAPTLLAQAPGAAAVAELLAAHRAAPPRSRLGRLAGLAPLSPSAAELYPRARIERETGELLRRLPADWTVLHSVPVTDGVVPHLLIGPAGVFALFPQPQADASVWVSADLLAVDGAGSDAVALAEASVAVVRRRLAGVLRPAIPVVPLVAFPRPERIVIRTPPRATSVLALEELVPWLRSLPEVCSAVIVDRIADTGGLPGTWGAEVRASADQEVGFAVLQAELAEAARRWTRTVRGMVAASLLLAAGGAALGAAAAGASLGA